MITVQQLLQWARTDPKKIIELFFWVEDRDSAEVIPFRFNDVQNYFYKNVWQSSGAEVSRRIDILKARQQGFSSLVLALYTVDFLFIPNIWCVCVSHEGEATKRLFRKVHNYIRRLPWEVKLDTSSVNMIVNKENGAVFYIGTAGSRSFGQGDTIHRLHLSELSRYPDPEKFIKNITPAIPLSGTIIKECTANGMGNYHHREWVREKAGTGAYKPFFCPWFWTKDYRMVLPGSVSWSSTEKEIMDQYRLIPEQMYWRREEIKKLGSEEAFQEQYPANDLEAFLSSGVSAFYKPSLEFFYNNTCRDPAFRGIFEEGLT